MIAGEVWHYWLGLILLVVGVASVIGLVVGYLKQVTAMKYPSRRQRQSQK
jgi:type III secretory pathway component EscS